MPDYASSFFDVQSWRLGLVILASVNIASYLMCLSIPRVTADRPTDSGRNATKGLRWLCYEREDLVDDDNDDDDGGPSSPINRVS